MNFRGRRSHAEPEINLIPFIDVLLVIVIFLMLTTTWSKLTEINLALPVADAQKQTDRPQQIVLTVTAQGAYAINRMPVPGQSPATLAAALGAVASREARLVISADASATHQAVIHAMQAARQAGLTQITFATQSGR
jgi:biopolymer transport protein ExbD